MIWEAEIRDRSRTLSYVPALAPASLRGAALEALNPPTGIYQLLAACVERVALRADLDVELGLRRTRRELVAAGAADMCFYVLGVDSLLHDGSC
jgi:hypothetical protein